MENGIFSDEKISKSLLNLRYLAYIFLFFVIIFGIIVTSVYGYQLYMEYPKEIVKISLWAIIFYITTFMISWGILDVLKMLTNLQKGNVFTIENAQLLKTIDKKLLFTLFFSLIINIIMTIANLHTLPLMMAWIIFICFILAGHILVNPLSLLVEKSVEMRIEMDLTI